MLLAGSLASSLAASAQSTMTVDGKQRNYVTYVPENLGTNRPLLISCHGMNQDANYQKGMLKIETVADTAKFVTVFPNGINKGWDIGGDQDIHFVLAIIDKMVDQYKIDRNRVYLSGFSMGGMFTYHAMNKIPDKIAAFAPISGYPMGGTTANANVRPIPIIHTHGTGDDVVSFSGVQGALNAWINHNGCPNQDVVVKNYRNAPHITRHTWGPGDNNVEVVLMEMKDKGHWISNDYNVLTGDEIWKFCKRYSLEMKDPIAKVTAPANGLTYVTFGGPSQVPSLTMKATASDPDGSVAKVQFYDNDTLLTEFTAPPFTFVLNGLSKGEHKLRAVVTDDEGRTGSSQTLVHVLEPTGLYSFHQSFTSEGSVPDGWTTYDGKEKRNGFSSGYSSGSRLFHLTGQQKDFEWGLYTRNVTGEKHAGYARLGDKTTHLTLTLYPGEYQLYTRVSNWNIPTFSPVTVAVETIAGQPVFEETFTPTSNVGNSASNDFSGTQLKNFLFNVEKKGRYVISFYTADAEWADLVVGQLAFRRKGDLSAVEQPHALSQTVAGTHYISLSGQCLQKAGRGPVIERTVMTDGTVRNRIIIK